MPPPNDGVITVGFDGRCVGEGQYAATGKVPDFRSGGGKRERRSDRVRTSNVADRAANREYISRDREPAICERQIRRIQAGNIVAVSLSNGATKDKWLTTLEERYRPVFHRGPIVVD